MYWRVSPGITAALVATILLVGVAIAQVSTNFNLGWNTFGSSGGTRQSANFMLQDAVGQTAPGNSASAGFVVQSGFAVGMDISSAGNPTPTATPKPAEVGGDTYEDDDVCVRAGSVATDGTKATHTFHDNGDADWLRFTAQAGKTYRIKVANLSDDADAIINLYDACNDTLSGQGQNSFGPEVVLEWDATKNGDYFVELRQFDPTKFGNGVNYEVSVTIDTTPPTAPQNIRCVAATATALNVQWQANPERDVKGYRVSYAGDISGVVDVSGDETTFTTIDALTTGQSYTVNVRAIDFSNNQSLPSGEPTCLLTAPVDATKPILTLGSPSAGGSVTVAGANLTFVGTASDSGNNLSRVKVTNQTAGVSGWDYSLTGSNDEFRVENIQLAVGENTVKVELFDTQGNQDEETLTVQRLGNVQGAVVVIAGRNDSNGLQSNIYNIANRTYRIFKSAGFTDEDIFYIAPNQQDADNDGLADDVDLTPSTPAAVENALVTWATGKVGPGKPLFVYLADHGFVDKFCLDGCGNSVAITPAQLNGWITQVETATGVDQVTVVLEACLSGSFITRADPTDLNSLSKPGRVIITSTSDDKNAYASAQGAYFSDAFFSCIADSQDLNTCFGQARLAVSTTGANQLPQMDDNGDALYTNGDGTVAQNRFVTRFFASLRPQIVAAGTVETEGATRTLYATIEEGAEAIEFVWAAIYPPSFTEPIDAVNNPTLNLNVPTVKLEDPDGDGRYEFTYVNGFTEPETETANYRLVFYAQDKNAIHAIPKGDFGGGNINIYLPIIAK
ncbi:MAG: fibronectin type III domain-containing protein [Caldilineaceae bacterium]